MDLAGAFLNVILTTIGYMVIFFGVYKVYQVATDIREIKELLVSGRRNAMPVAPPASVGVTGLTPEVAKELLGEDSATAYAQSLLRAVNSESRALSETQEVR
ncbi:MAG: hypothetical protein M3N41_04310 [Acidobacteriota bacterium]|nr:hypothetical protein [Acidobacteriota bacterium]